MSIVGDRKGSRVPLLLLSNGELRLITQPARKSERPELRASKGRDASQSYGFQWSYMDVRVGL